MTEHDPQTVEYTIDRESPLPKEHHVTQVPAANPEEAARMAREAAIAAGAEPGAITVTAVNGKPLHPEEGTSGT